MEVLRAGARISLVSAHRLHAECLATALSANGRIGRVAVRDQSEVVGADDVLIVDIQREAERLLGAVESIAARARPRIVLITAADAIDVLTRGLALRPAAVVAGDSSIEELSRIVERVARGEHYFCERLAYALSRHLASLGLARRRQDSTDALRLSPRELEVLELIADGLDNRTIADRLCLSVYTVKNHVHSILDKLDVTNRTEAAAHGLRRNWLAERRRRAQ